MTHLGDLPRGQVIGMREEGGNVTKLVSEFRIAHSIVSRVWRGYFKLHEQLSKDSDEVIYGNHSRGSPIDIGKRSDKSQETCNIF
ncbi:hypothetical protein TNIN_183421 [Trichonephila inaurata madagascariensis]|uniref:Uncharacterized protein n=1 Tax=Trichonephila inaurata madagascariensis TaxID=2747483 RepID=A0A8X6JC40_9ARAC|nr:hypothetical protein TNIN_183421 [Trichonephila inaurata madagascariensis]